MTPYHKRRDKIDNNQQTLNHISDDKILGVQVDDHLLFTYHININKTVRKITFNIWLLSRIKDY